MPNTFTPEQIAQILEEFFNTVGTRQYIGARYVPIFGRKGEDSIIWDNSAPYEPLTIVLYQGNSFTSRQYVPEGVEITNQEFWAQTGNYNAQIEQYRQETARALEAAQDAQDDIDELLPKSDFSAENTVSDIITSVRQLAQSAQDDIDELLPKSAFSAESTVKDYIDSRIVINPDSYEGTDTQKLQAALNAATGNDIIFITREYVIESDITLNHDVEATNRVILRGFGENAAINMQTNSFKTAGGNRGMYTFADLLFEGSDVCFNVDYLLRLNFENCSFIGFHYVFYNTHYMQSIYLHCCTIRYIDQFVIYSAPESGVSLLDVQLSQCLVEKCAGFVSAYTFNGVTIHQCCIEGLYDVVCKVLGDARSLNFTENYFEGINDGTYLPDGEVAGDGTAFDFTGMVGVIQSVNIERNRIVAKENAPYIKLPNYNPSRGNILIADNNTSTNVMLVKTHTDFTGLYTSVTVGGSPYAKYENTAQLRHYDLSNLYTNNSIPSGVTDLNNIGISGIYYVPASASYTNEPFTGTAYYLINFQRAVGTSFIQIAFSSTETKHRIGTGQWV